MQRIDRTGETKTMNNGMKATIIGCDGCRNITVRFSDGTVVSNRYYSNFCKGRIDNPNVKNTSSKSTNRIGLTKKMNCGLKATIIEYKISRKMKVRFENGVEKNCSWTDFRDGTITPLLMSNFVNPSDRVGQKQMQSCGEECEVIAYKDTTHITVRFLSSGLTKQSSWKSFTSGLISNNNTIKEQKENNKNLEGKTFVNYAGIDFKVIEYKSARDVVIRFSDGVLKNTQFSQIKKKCVAHPGFDKSGSVRVHNITGVRKLVTSHCPYYKCTCSSCGFSGLMTANEILSHQC